MPTNPLEKSNICFALHQIISPQQTWGIWVFLTLFTRERNVAYQKDRIFQSQNSWHTSLEGEVIQRTTLRKLGTWAKVTRQESTYKMEDGNKINPYG